MDECVCNSQNRRAISIDLKHEKKMKRILSFPLKNMRLILKQMCIPRRCHILGVVARPKPIPLNAARLWKPSLGPGATPVVSASMRPRGTLPGAASRKTGQGPGLRWRGGNGKSDAIPSTGRDVKVENPGRRDCDPIRPLAFKIRSL